MIYFLQHKCVYADKIHASLLEKEIEIVSLSSHEFVKTFAYHCEVSSESNAVFVLSISCHDEVNKVIKSLNTHINKNRPRLVVLSTTLIWSGESSVAIDDPSVEFYSRHPSASSSIEYVLENKLWHTSKDTNTEVIIIAIGLIYGLNGFDFDALFKFIWSSECSTTDEKFTLYSTRIGNNCVPTIHFNDFINLLIYSFQLHSTSLVGCSKYLIAADGNMDSVIFLLNKLMKDSDSKMIDVISDADKIADVIMQDDRQYIWSCNMQSQRVDKYTNACSNANCDDTTAFALTYCNGLIDNFQSLWLEYVQSENLNPVKIMVAGGPLCGKTALSLKLAEELSIDYIDTINTIKHMISISTVAEDPDTNTSTLPPFAKDLFDAMTAKVLESKKAVAKKGEDAGPVDLSTVEVTEALCSSLPAELVRKSIAYMISTKPSCVLKGFVIDVWSSSIIDSVSNFNELMIHHETRAISTAATTDTTANDGDKSPDLVTSVDETVAMPDAFEFIIELACTDDVIMKRFMNSNSIVTDDPKVKPTKEQLAAIKTLETSLATYAAKLKAIDSTKPATVDDTSNGSDIADAPLIYSHTAISDIELASSCKSIKRLDVSTLLSEPDSIVSIVVSSILDVHGSIPWTKYIKTVVAAALLQDNNSAMSCDDVSDNSKQAEVIAAIAASSTVTSINDLNGQLEGLSIENRQSLVSSIDKLQSFLTNTILEYVSKGMVNIARDEPEDPIMYLSNYLRREGERLEVEARSEAKQNYFQTIKDAEENIAAQK